MFCLPQVLFWVVFFLGEWGQGFGPFERWSYNRWAVCALRKGATNPSHVPTAHELQTFAIADLSALPGTLRGGQVVSVCHSHFKGKPIETQRGKNQWMSERGEVPCKGFPPTAPARPRGCFVQERCISAFR